MSSLFFFSAFILLNHLTTASDDDLYGYYDDDTVNPRLLPLSTTMVDDINTAHLTWTARNNFPDILLIQLEMLAGSYVMEENTKITYKRHDTSNIAIPVSFDARKKWSECQTIKVVPEQGHCGSCWAVAAAAAISDRTCIISKGKINYSLSPEELMTCCSDCVVAPPNGCDGGDSLRAFTYWHRHGLVSGGPFQSLEGCKPYSIFTYSNHPLRNFSCQLSCTNLQYQGDFDKELRIYGKSLYKLPKNMEQIQIDIMTNGPVVASMDLYEDFYLYQQGVYIHTVGNSINRSHCVKIIGWGKEKDTLYWLVTNFWGKEWGGEGGFFLKFYATTITVASKKGSSEEFLYSLCSVANPFREKMVKITIVHWYMVKRTVRKLAAVPTVAKNICTFVC